jgi:hypothetical protein
MTVSSSTMRGTPSTVKVDLVPAFGGLDVSEELERTTTPVLRFPEFASVRGPIPMTAKNIASTTATPILMRTNAFIPVSSSQ